MKQTKRKKTVKKAKNTKLLNEIKYLELLRDCSIKAVTGNFGSVDDLFVAQALRIEEEIKKLKGNQ